MRRWAPVGASAPKRRRRPGVHTSSPRPPRASATILQRTEPPELRRSPTSQTSSHPADLLGRTSVAARPDATHPRIPHPTADPDLWPAPPSTVFSLLASAQIATFPAPSLLAQTRRPWRRAPPAYGAGAIKGATGGGSRREPEPLYRWRWAMSRNGLSARALHARLTAHRPTAPPRSPPPLLFRTWPPFRTAPAQEMHRGSSCREPALNCRMWWRTTFAPSDRRRSYHIQSRMDST